MKKKEIRNGIKTVYRQLWSLLSLYETSKHFNEIPLKERQTANSDEDVWDFVGRKLSAVREEASVLFLGEPEIAKRLNRIIDETEYFTRQYTVPGVADRWKEVNPQLFYFECVFDFIEDDPGLYLKVSQGSYDEIHFDFHPDAEMIAARKVYFSEIKEKNEKGNLRYSGDKIFQNELLHTMKLLFEKEFKEYL